MEWVIATLCFVWSVSIALLCVFSFISDDENFWGENAIDSAVWACLSMLLAPYAAWLEVAAVRAELKELREYRNRKTTGSSVTVKTELNPADNKEPERDWYVVSREIVNKRKRLILKDRNSDRMGYVPDPRRIEWDRAERAHLDPYQWWAPTRVLLTEETQPAKTAQPVREWQVVDYDHMSDSLTVRDKHSDRTGRVATLTVLEQREARYRPRPYPWNDNSRVRLIEESGRTTY